MMNGWELNGEKRPNLLLCPLLFSNNECVERLEREDLTFSDLFFKYELFDWPRMRPRHLVYMRGSVAWRTCAGSFPPPYFHKNNLSLKIHSF